MFFFQNLPWTIKEQQLVVWLHFPAYSFDWDLELAFLVFPNFGYFTQYLTESKEPSGGPSQYYIDLKIKERDFENFMSCFSLVFLIFINIP